MVDDGNKSSGGLEKILDFQSVINADVQNERVQKLMSRELAVLVIKWHHRFRQVHDDLLSNSLYQALGSRLARRSLQ